MRRKRPTKSPLIEQIEAEIKHHFRRKEPNMRRPPIIPPPDMRLAIPAMIVIALWLGIISYGGFVAEHFIQKFW